MNLRPLIDGLPETVRNAIDRLSAEAGAEIDDEQIRQWILSDAGLHNWAVDWAKKQADKDPATWCKNGVWEAGGTILSHFLYDFIEIHRVELARRIRDIATSRKFLG